MESQSQNPDFRSNPENFHPCTDRVHLLKIILTVFAPSTRNVKFEAQWFQKCLNILMDGDCESLESMSKIGSGEQKFTQHAKR